MASRDQGEVINSDVRESRQSPDWVRTSTAAAMTMGLLPGRFYNDAKLFCLNMLLTYDEGCAARCAYCGLSGSRNGDCPWEEQSFIRVDWPTVSIDDVVSKIKSGACPHIERVCVSMITNPKALDDTLAVVGRLKPFMERISTLVAPTIIDGGWLVELREAGADMVGIAVDAATKELFDNLRGLGVRGSHRWETYWESVEEAVEIFGRRRVGVHLIVGLGETEREMVETIQRVHDMGASTHLFSFFPEEGSIMQGHPQPPIGQYRRVQLARYMIDYEASDAGSMNFDDEGRLVNLGVAGAVLDEIIDGGNPFMTSGCPGEHMENACNRPFGNCTPYQASIGEMRNFPYTPCADEIMAVRKQLHGHGGPTPSDPPSR